MTVAIVVVAYNGRGFLEHALASGVQYGEGAPIYVVDNASTDGLADLLAEKFPHIRPLRQSKNLGFAGGNNVGIKAAMAAGAEAVFLLNQDAALTPGALPTLERYLTQHPETAAVQPLLLLPDGKVNSIGNSFHYLGFSEAGGNGRSRDQATAQCPWVKGAEVGEPPAISGAGVLLRVAALQAVGLLEERLFLYHEDLELSLRLRLAGWHLAVCPEAVVVHHYEHSRSLTKFYYMERNRGLVWFSFWKWPTLLMLAIPAILCELSLLVLSIPGGWTSDKLRADAYFLRPDTWAYVGKRRRELKRLRRQPDRVMFSWASARLSVAPTGSWVLKFVFNPLSELAWAILQPLLRW